MILAALAAALALQALPAPGSVTWEVLTIEDDGRTWLDPASLARDGDVVRFLLRTEGVDAQRGGIGTLILRLHVRCQHRQMGMEVADAYRLNGDFLETRSVPPGAIVFDPLGATEAHAALHRRVCGVPPV